MAQSVGAIALDVVMGKNTVNDVVKQAMSECQQTISDSSASVSQKVGAIGNACTSVGASLMPVSTAVTGVGVAAFKSASSFEDAMAKVSTIADSTQVPMDDLKKAILDLSNQTGVSSAEIADNVYNAISAGQSTGDAVNFVSNSTKLATAGFADAGQSLDLLTTILNAYGMEAGQVTNVSDMLIQTQNLGKTTVAELASSMGKIIPTANAYGVGLDNVCAGYAKMTANGVSTAESTTYMNSMLNELGKSGSKTSDILKEKTGQSFADLMAGGASLGDVLGILQQYCNDTGTQFTDLWSSAEAGKSALILAKDGADGFNSTLGQMQNSTGATDSAFEKMKTTSWDMKKALNEAKNTLIDLGSALMQTLGPIIQDACGKVKAFTEWFSKLDDGTKQIIVKIGLVLAAAGPVLIFAGKVISSISSIISVASTFIGFISGTVIPALGSFFAFIIANPIVLVIGAIVAAGILLVTHWKEVKQIASEVWNGICNIIKTVWDAIKQAITIAINAIKQVVTTVWNAIKSFITTVCNAIKTVVTTVWNAIKSFVSTVCNAIKTVVTGVWNGIKTAITTVVNAIKTVVTTVFNAIKSTIGNVCSAIKSVVSGAWNGIKSVVSSVSGGIKSVAVGAFNGIKSGISSAGSGIKSVVSNIFSGCKSTIKGFASKAVEWGADFAHGLADGIKGAAGKVGDAVKGVANKVKSFLHFSRPDEGPLAEYEAWMPDFMSGLAKGITDNSGLVTGALANLTGDMSVNPALSINGPALSRVNGGSANNNSDKIDKLIALLEKFVDKKQDINDEITVPVYIGNELIDEYITKKNSRQIIRSGGRA